MKKSARSLAGLAVGLSAAAVIAPSAQAATPWGPWGVFDGNTFSKSAPANLEVLGSDGNNGGGWCDNGQPTAAIAVHTLKGSETVYVRYFTSQNDSPTLKLVNVTTKGVLVPVPAGFAATSSGGNTGDMYFSNTSDIITTVAAANDGNVASFEAKAPGSCAGLPTKAPALPAAWGNVSTPVTTPTKPVVTPKPVVTAPTNPVAVKTTTPAKPSASVTVSATATKSGVTKSTSTTAVVPVKSSVPAGGVTSTVKVTAPAQGVTSTATVKVNPVTSTSAPVAPTSSSAATSGPKVQTDQVSNSNNTTEEALVGGMGALLLAGGVTVVARRRR